MAKKKITKKAVAKKTAKSKPKVKAMKKVVKAKPKVKAVKETLKTKTKPKLKTIKKIVKAVKKKLMLKPKIKAISKKIKPKKVAKAVKVKVSKKITKPAVKQKAVRKHAVKGYPKKDLEHFRKIILAKKNEILDQLQNLREQMLDPTTGEYINENSPYSLHMAEQGTDAMEREKTFLYAQRENKFLGYLEDAMKRIDAGTYGLCLECIDEPQFLCDTCPLIPKARLEAVPHSQLCLPIKMKQEKKILTTS
jgi:RNA polymerase-binding transcription factor DksA